MIVGLTAAAGCVIMGVSTYFLIEGMSALGDAGHMNTIGGIALQIGESVLLFVAGGWLYKKSGLRYTAVTLGILAAVFSVTMMTLAQKSSIESGQHHANKIDKKVARLEARKARIQRRIDSIMPSIQKDLDSTMYRSRGLKREEQKITPKVQQIAKIDLQLDKLESQRKLTNSQIMQDIADFLHVSVVTATMIILWLRSFLFEGSAIVLFMIAGYLFQERREYKQRLQEQELKHQQATRVNVDNPYNLTVQKSDNQYVGVDQQIDRSDVLNQPTETATQQSDCDALTQDTVTQNDTPTVTFETETATNIPASTNGQNVTGAEKKLTLIQGFKQQNVTADSEKRHSKPVTERHSQNDSVTADRTTPQPNVTASETDENHGVTALPRLHLHVANLIKEHEIAQYNQVVSLIKKQTIKPSIRAIVERYKKSAKPIADRKATRFLKQARIDGVIDYLDKNNPRQGYKLV